MTIPSNCHNASGEWIPERQPMADTLRAMGAPMPEFDRQTFVKKLYMSKYMNMAPATRKLHWEGSDRCSTVSQIAYGIIEGRWRIVTKNVFASLPPSNRCENCNQSYLLTK